MAIQSPKVLVTGATGFLGSHLAEGFLEANYEVIATRRTESDLWRCTTFQERIHWINIDQSEWTQQIIALKPDIIIHGAWSGVVATERLNWQTQISNTFFLATLLTIAEAVNLQTFIGLGSQAEYGTYDGKIAENYPTNPITAYGVAKLMSFELVRGFFSRQSYQPTKWYWLRLFTCFGEREDRNWLIPSMIRQMKIADNIALTPGEQRSAYLYVRDFTRMVLKMVESEAESGIFNISSNQLFSVKELMLELKDITGSQSKLNFGSLPYRAGQPMHIEGDMTKFTTHVGYVPESDFRSNLRTTVQSFYPKETTLT